MIWKSVTKVEKKMARHARCTHHSRHARRSHHLRQGGRVDIQFQELVGE